jgi:hypothetical protein
MHYLCRLAPKLLLDSDLFRDSYWMPKMIIFPLAFLKADQPLWPLLSKLPNDIDFEAEFDNKTDHDQNNFTSCGRKIVNVLKGCTK